MTREKVHILRCASAFGVAAYAKNTPHFSGLARLVYGSFCGVINYCVIPAKRLCRNSGITIKVVMPAQAGIQNSLILLDSPVSSTGQAQSRASLEFIRRMPDGMTTMAIYYL